MGLKQFGGENIDKYQGNKSDLPTEQFGGEGGGKDGKVLGKGEVSQFTPGPTPVEKYTGAGRFLKSEQF